MKKKVSGIISFIGAIVGLCFSLFWWLDAYLTPSYTFMEFLFDDTGVLLVMGVLFSVSIMLYIIFTKLGDKHFLNLKKIDIENQILKKQIEQCELKNKLKE
jgi:uncharacterized membrane protein